MGLVYTEEYWPELRVMWTVIDCHCRVNDSALFHPSQTYYNPWHYCTAGIAESLGQWSADWFRPLLEQEYNVQNLKRNIVIRLDTVLGMVSWSDIWPGRKRKNKLVTYLDPCIKISYSGKIRPEIRKPGATVCRVYTGFLSDPKRPDYSFSSVWNWSHLF